MSHYADLLGVGGQLLGTCRFKLKLSAGVLAPLRAFRQMHPDPRPQLALTSDPVAAAAQLAEQVRTQV
eukprot:1182863-Prorocentrum_minimum.AAC.2